LKTGAVAGILHGRADWMPSASSAVPPVLGVVGFLGDEVAGDRELVSKA
jgi:hypothetical protein